MNLTLSQRVAALKVWSCVVCLLAPEADLVSCEVDGLVCEDCHKGCTSAVCARENGPVEEPDPLDDYDVVVDLLEWADCA